MVINTGTNGNDTLYGGPGGDELIGLAGDDTYGVYSQFDTVVEKPGEGNDRVLTFASYVLASGASIETLSTAINSGTDSVQLTGNELNQVIVGNEGANTIDGRGGGDPMVGLGGNDVYYVTDRTDFIVEAAGGGTDTVYVRGDFVLNGGSSVEDIDVFDRTSTTGFFLGGNELGQSIFGGAGNDLINGGGQPLRGGRDWLFGGAGDDIYRIFGDNQFNGNNAEIITEYSGQGNDALYTSGSFQLSAWSSVEFISTANNAGLEAINLVGNGIGQIIIGNYGDNQLLGYIPSGGTDPGPYAGPDTLIGLFGNDTYRVYDQQDIVIEQPGQGTDAVYTDYDYTLRPGTSVEMLAPTQTGWTLPLRFKGNEIASVVMGNFGANTLDGGGGNDTLVGLDGDDAFSFSTTLGPGNVPTILDFGRGADTIQLDRAIFSVLPLGALAASAISYGPIAFDADDRIIYDPATGALSYDPDGNGAIASVQFASLTTNLPQSVLQATVVAPADPRVVSATIGGTYLIGGATGTGISTTDAYPDAISIAFGKPIGRTTDFSFVFGPESANGRLSLSFVGGSSVDTFDFSQLSSGMVYRGADYRTSGGATIVSVWSYQTADAYPRTFVVHPKTLIGSAFDDLIDRSADGYEGIGFGIVRGGAGNDTLIGGEEMYGEAGNDRLTGVGGLASMWGGEGRDTFVLPIYSPAFFGSRPNYAKDFNPAEDRIDLVLNIASDLPVGELAAYRLGIGSAASTADQRILYDPATGLLRFDGNGNLPDAADVRPIFAVLPPGLDLTHVSFNVILP